MFSTARLSSDFLMAMFLIISPRPNHALSRSATSSVIIVVPNGRTRYSILYLVGPIISLSPDKRRCVFFAGRKDRLAQVERAVTGSASRNLLCHRHDRSGLTTHWPIPQLTRNQVQTHRMS